MDKLQKIADKIEKEAAGDSFSAMKEALLYSEGITSALDDFLEAYKITKISLVRDAKDPETKLMLEKLLLAQATLLGRAFNSIRPQLEELDAKLLELADTIY